MARTFRMIFTFKLLHVVRGVNRAYKKTQQTQDENSNEMGSAQIVCHVHCTVMNTKQVLQQIVCTPTPPANELCKI